MTGPTERFGGRKQMLDRRELMKRAGMAALVTGLGPRGALALDTVTLPFDNGERPLVRYPQKRPMIGLTSRPPQLETPFSIFNDGLLTPNNAFFVRYHLSDLPYNIDPDTFTLEIKGKVDKPLNLSLSDIRKLKATEIVAVNQCSGNSRGFFDPRVAGGQLGNGAMGNARWRGVPLKTVLDKAGVQQGAKQVTFNGMDGPVADKTPDFVKALDIDHARDGEVMLAYGMNGEDLPVLNGFPLRLVVPGYYGTYWVKHLNEINVIDDVFDGYWMKSAYRIPDTPCGCVEPGTAPKATIPINRFTVRSFITSVRDGTKLRPGGTTLKGIAFDGGKTRQGSRKIFVPRMEVAGEARGGQLRTQGSRDQQCRRHAADGAYVESGRLPAQRRRNRSRHRGVMESNHDPSIFPPAFVRCHGHRRSGFHFSKRGAGLLHASGGDRGVQ